MLITDRFFVGIKFFVVTRNNVQTISESKINLKKYIWGANKNRLYYEALPPRITKNSAEIRKYFFEFIVGYSCDGTPFALIKVAFVMK